MKCVEERKTTNFGEKHFLKETLKRFFLGGLKVSKSLNLLLGFLFKKYLSPLPLPVPQKNLSEKMYRLGGGRGWTFFSHEMC